MSTTKALRNKLESIHGQDYRAYQSLLGTYDSKFRLIVHQIPKDPYAPSHAGVYRVQVSRSDTGVINRKTEIKIQAIAFRDFLARRFHAAAAKVAAAKRGAGYSGIITSIRAVDISSFIRDLPFQKETTAFSTQNASGSTSQAAGIIEAVAGSILRRNHPR